MDFKLNFEIPKAYFTIQHGDSILFLGSCFSDEIANKSAYHGLKVQSNPFGTVFHPNLLSQFITDSINEIETERVLNREDLYFSWDANSTVYDFSEANLIEKLHALRSDFKNQLKQAKVIFITFGTAWAYRRKDDTLLVANCHKVPASEFDKELIEVEEMYFQWMETIEKLKELNPKLEIVFTVSPVRHIRDGLIENNQSKAILLDLVRRLIKHSEVTYFPSYEIIIDELRDYRFFKTDRVHPNEEAIEYVWKQFENIYCTAETININSKVAGFRKSINHKSIHENSKENQERKSKTEESLNDFLKKNPTILF